MAIVFESWEMDGPKGEARIDYMRVKRLADAKDWIESQKKNPRCVLITYSHTSRKRTTWVDVWKAEGYSSETTK